MKARTKLSLMLLVVLIAMVPILQACGNSKGGDGGKIKIKWATWGNPGELGRFQEFTDEYNKKNPNVQVELIPIPGEYEQKILTQLSGGTAPDAFYSGDGTIVKLIENNSIYELTPFMEAPDSKIKPTDFFEGLYGAAKREGKVYGVTVDDNPMVIWYNKKVLRDAGITEMPADLFEKGQWNWNTFRDITKKVKATGKYGYVLDNWWGHYYSWVSTNGGKVYDDKGKFIGHEDAKAKEAFKFLYDNIKDGTITFSGTLPKGQGGDAMFMSNQVAFVGAGRWYLPIFKKNEGLEFDIVPWPTNTGNKMEPAGIPTAYMVMNKATKHKEEVYKFIAEFVSKDGQIFRLSGGGNAVPSIAGADQVVLEGNLPEHAQYFLDAREIGYALTPFEAGVPGLSGEITSKLEALWLKGDSFEDALKDIGQAANKKIDDYKSGK
jgi:multiple sugar transport system substrate-binding protein